ncbi:MAG: flagellar hook-associated protein FlgL [Deltaproteobacteria bacterium]|nr:flagellar hook-associated protein FlgL [Deltaproteobacteria bacterium]MBW2085176.1 flagellar hook-associated protein FlgL [Deltaproteobacteria bacterium]
MNRVSQQSLYSMINFNLQRITYDLSKLNESISSGKKVNRPSDDILGGANILTMRTVLADIEQYQRDLSVANNLLMLSESALLNMKNSVTEAKVLAEQMSTETYQDSNLDVAAVAIDGIIDEIINLGNTSMEGRYIFAGSKTDTAPFIKELNIHDATAALAAASAYTGRAASAGTYTGSQSKEYMVQITSAGGAEALYASLTTNFDNTHDDLTITAKTAGPDGDNISIEYVDPLGINQPLGVVVNDLGGGVYNIQVNLATDGAGAIVSTAAEVMNAINTDPSASALVTASLAPGSDGSGVVSDMSGVPRNLSRGFSYASLTTNFASLTTSLADANDDLRLTAQNAGESGNDIRIRYVDPGASGQSLTIAVDGNDITVNLATDGTGAITTTATQVMNAINGDPEASALVSADLAGTDDGSGVVTAMGFTSLTTGRHNDLKFTALISGTEGNKISLIYNDPHLANQTTEVTVNNLGGGNYEIQVTLATDADGNISATAADVLAAIQAHDPVNPLDVAAGELVQVSLAEGSSGLGLINQIGTWSLAGSEDVAARFKVSEDGGLTWGPDDAFAASVTGTNIWDSTKADLDQGVQIAFTNEGTLSVSDQFTIEVSHYLGNTEDLEVNIQRNHRVKANVNGEEAMGGAGDPDNLLDCLFRLKQALLDHDPRAVADELPVFDQILENLSSQMAQTGVRINRTEVAGNILESTKIGATQRLSDIEDTDLIEAITALKLQEMAYQATLASTSMITSLSLLDYIR